MSSNDTAIPPLTAWIADDGELAPVRRLLWEHGVVLAEELEAPPSWVDLLVTNPRHALKRDSKARLPGARVHILVTEDPNPRLMQQLRRTSCDFIADADVHPDAMRLLVEYALYAGPERRSGARAPMSLPVQLKVGRRAREATLIQLSIAGCGLSLPTAVTGEKLLLRLPTEWTGGEKIEVPLVILEDVATADGDHLVSCRFGSVDTELKRMLAEEITRVGREVGLLEARKAEAPKSTSKRTKKRAAGTTTKPASSLPAKNATDAGDDDRRKSARAAYRLQMLATGEGRSHVLLGRDISVGGMRVGPDPDLQVGQEIKLALYGSGRRDRIIVRARVVRDAGEEGLGLAFQRLKPAVQERLTKLVDQALVLRGGASDGRKSPNVVVSEILDEEDAD